jgi:acetyl/propionyl-CoA carboxylase alpha subunit
MARLEAAGRALALADEPRPEGDGVSADASGELGRVAVLDRHGGARRVLRALADLAQAGRAGATVAVHAPGDRFAAFVREADEAVEQRGTIEEALRAARATAAWLGPASLEERAAFAEACAAAGVTPLGPPAAALRRLAAPRAVAELAAELGVAPEDAEARDAPARLVEVVVAVDGGGAARALGTGDASLSSGDVTVVAEAPASLPGEVAETARAIAERALAAVGWRGVGVVRFAVTRGGRRLALAAVDAFAASAPAVEEATGVDLVRLALRLAAGGAVERSPAMPRGHAIAARIQARDPEGEAARTGKVELMRLPSGPGIRAHAAVAEGDEASAGAVLATVIAVADERGEAIARLARALSEADVLVRGSATSRAWLRGLLARP